MLHRHLRRRASSVRLVASASAVALATVVAFAAAARAADKPRLLFEDDFATLDPTLGSANDTLGVRDNTLFRTLDGGYWWRTFYEALLFENVDASIQVRLADFEKPNDDAIGIAFWGVDLDNFYVLQISDSGTFAIYRRDDEGWRFIAPWRPHDAIKTAADEWNELRIVTSGNRATAYINGQEVATFSGRPPAGGSLLGVFFEGGENPATGEFSNLRVAKGTDAPPAPAVDPNVLLVDDFEYLDPTLGVLSDTLTVADNMLTRTLDAEFYWRAFYQIERFTNADATLRVRLADFAAEMENKIGLAFWGDSVNDYYVLEISDSGTFAVSHATPDGWFGISRWRDTDAIKIDPDEWNELRVVTSGGKATIYINGKELVTVKGRPPAGGGMFGLFAESNADGTTFQYSAMRVRLGPEPPAADPSNDPGVLLADDFSMFDPAWGAEQGWFGVADGHMFIDFDPGQAFTALYEGALFQDVDATVDVRFVNSTDHNAASGLAFWTDGGDDYYLVVLFRGGSIMVTRRLNGEWKEPLPSRALPEECHFDPAAWTKLRLVTDGSKATVYVNGVNIATVSGQPPEDGSMFGLWAQSAENPSRSEFANLIIRQPAESEAE